MPCLLTTMSDDTLHLNGYPPVILRHGQINKADALLYIITQQSNIRIHVDTLRIPIGTLQTGQLW
jgi:hypothetical protein